jgi:OHCU decarboxylase
MGTELTREQFVEAYGFAYESSPWVAERAFEAAPFANLDELMAAMRTTVDEAEPERQIELLRAHPDLASRASMTPASSGEQASAGLDRLDPQTHARLTSLTADYRRRFGFPFVICVREHTVASILDRLTRRVANDAETERSIAIAEVHKIAALRLRDR